MPLAEARALISDVVSAGVRARWHPDYPTGDTVDALQMLLAAHAAMGPPLVVEPVWWIHQILVEGQVVGDVGFHGPPGASGEVEIGYQVVPAWRGQGVASAAVALVLQRAWGDGAARVRAETDPENFASQHVLLVNGLVQDADRIFRIARPTS